MLSRVQAGVGVELFALSSHSLLLGWRLMLSAPTGTICAAVIFKKRFEDFVHAVLSTELDTSAIADPCALIFAVSTLYLFVLAREDLFLEDFGALALVYAGNFQDLSRIEPAITAAAHYGDTADFHFVDGYS